MQINFFDDPEQAPRSREEVEINEIGVQVYPDGRRVAIGFDLTPFIERPSLAVRVRNGLGVPAGATTIIETLEPNFTVILHLRDGQPSNPYQLEAIVYYARPGEAPLIVHQKSVTFERHTAQA